MAVSTTAVPDLVSNYRAAARDLLAAIDRVELLKRTYNGIGGQAALSGTFAAGTEGGANAGIARADFTAMVSNLDTIVAATAAVGFRDTIEKVAR